MSLVSLKITDKAISAYIVLPAVNVLRDTLNPLLQLRFSSKRVRGYWRILYRNKWVKVGDWPEVKTVVIRQNFSMLIGKVRDKQEVRANKDCLVTVGDVLTWYDERAQENTVLSEQRQKNIASAIKCHLMPSLADVELELLNKGLLDKQLIRPLQKKLMPNSVGSVFLILKAAFNAAYELDLLTNNTLAVIKLSSFKVDANQRKEPRLFPYLVAALLDDMGEQRIIVQMICMTMLTLGTRLGETRLAKWHNFNLAKNPVWIIPKQDTKTNKTHTIHLPADVVFLLQQWKLYQKKCNYNGKYLFPDFTEKKYLSANNATDMIHSFSGGEWSSHDLRKCARICWQEQGVDSMVGEIMLNHSVGKVAESYISSAVSLRLIALENHCKWLKEQNNQCFVFNPNSTQEHTEFLEDTSTSAA